MLITHPRLPRARSPTFALLYRLFVAPPLLLSEMRT